MVATRNASVAGFLFFRMIADEFHLMRIAVDPAARNRGIGHQLLSSALATAASRGAVHALLEVNAQNLAAIALYKSFGFQIEGRRRDYYGAGEDALNMGGAVRPPETG